MGILKRGKGAGGREQGAGGRGQGAGGIGDSLAVFDWECFTTGCCLQI
nr:hypothetical protein [Hassalia byssoidea]